jgi:hypothetical protein
LDDGVRHIEHSDGHTTTPAIDPSCLDALDDQLLVSPIDSFMDVCWADAVVDHDPYLDTDSPTLYNATVSTPQKVLDDYQDLDPFASDNEKWHGDEDVLVVADVENVCDRYAVPWSSFP